MSCSRRALAWAALTPCGWVATLAAGAALWVIAAPLFVIVVPVAIASDVAAAARAQRQ